jgi:pimeloyl-ACP methyl ester carboxylesterase
MWRERQVEADGFTITAWEAGEGDPLVVLHGGGGPQRLPAHETVAAAGHRVVVLELPGFGASAANWRTETFEDLAATVGAAVDALGIERYALCGTSFGGVTAAWLAAQHAERVSALVLVAPAAFRVGGPIPDLPPEALLRALRAHPEEEAGPPPDAATIDKQITLVRRVFAASDDEALRPHLEALDVPTMVVFGTRDGLVPPETGREYKRLIARCDLVYVHDAAHEVAADRPQAFAGLVGDFVARREGHVVRLESRELVS